MTHPVEQLVDFVDGTLPAGERAVVDAHLRTCARCRQEVTLARGAASALASLPEVQAPEGLGAAAIRRAEADAAERAPEVAALSPRRDRMQRTGTPAWYRWGGMVGAAAAILLVIVVALPKLGGAPDTPEAADGAAPTLQEAGQPARPAAEVNEEDRDYDVAALEELAEDYAAKNAVPPVATDGALGPSSPVSTAESSFRSSVACLQSAASPLVDAGPPVQVIRARFDGSPAVIGVYLSGPGADQPADTVTVWVVSTGNCRRILHSTQVLI